MPAGSARQTQAALMKPSSETPAKAQRQPAVSATHAVTGMPTTELMLQPKKMNAIARPRSAAGASAVIAAAACGVKTAAPSTASARAGSSVA